MHEQVLTACGSGGSGCHGFGTLSRSVPLSYTGYRLHSTRGSRGAGEKVELRSQNKRGCETGHGTLKRLRGVIALGVTIDGVSASGLCLRTKWQQLPSDVAPQAVSPEFLLPSLP